MPILPEPWASMTDEQLRALDEVKARAMMRAVTTPGLEALRQKLPKMSTSELIVTMIRPNNRFHEQLLPNKPDDIYASMYSHEEELLILSAAMTAIGDEIDRRVPRPV